ncbi:MAG TPA: hypothetical protein VNH65_13940 [Candidatus Acidoferrum sp.]|nr:hypothetical protein [Candidatus Acidoferrum sp.]
MTENLRELAESFMGATPDGVLASKILKNVPEIKRALATNGEYVLRDECGNEYHIRSSNGHQATTK